MITDDEAEITVNAEAFVVNLDRLMTLHGYYDASLAVAVGVSRQCVGLWRSGNNLPTAENFARLCELFSCKLEDFSGRKTNTLPPMLPLTQWAKQKGVSIAKARQCFSLGLLTGATGSEDRTVFVPVNVAMPSSDEVREAVKRSSRPIWTFYFEQNFRRRLEDTDVSLAEIGRKLDVPYQKIVAWRNGRSYPPNDLLPRIADALGCSVLDLIRRERNLAA